MKKIKNLILPVGLVLLGTGGAFATQEKSNQSTAIVDGYRIDPETLQCIDMKKQCSTTGSVFCTWSDGVTTHELYELGETLCDIKLFEP